MSDPYVIFKANVKNAVSVVRSLGGLDLNSDKIPIELQEECRKNLAISLATLQNLEAANKNWFDQSIADLAESSKDIREGKNRQRIE